MQMPSANNGPDIMLISLQVDLDTIGLKTLHYTLLRQSIGSLLVYLPEFCAGVGQAHIQARALTQVRDFIAGLRVRLLGISLMSHEYKAAALLTDYLKQQFPELVVIWGGIHPAIAPEMCLAHADYICVGEGEVALPAFVRAVQNGCQSPDQVASIWWKDGHGRIVKNKLAPCLQNLDEIAVSEHLPKNSFVLHGGQIRLLDRGLLKQYGRWQGTVYSVMGSRGCPFSCAYCCNNFLARLYGTHAIRRRSVSSLIGELEKAVRDNPYLQFINFQDDCFLACPDDYLEAFCKAYTERVHIPFVVRCIPTTLTEKRLAMLKAAGVAWVSMGLQSGSDRVLTDVYGRRALQDDFVRAAAIVNKLKIAAYYDVIFDNPLETEDDRLDTLLTVAKLPRPYFLQIFSLVVYPGTALYKPVTAVCPDKAREYLSKNYHAYKHDTLNAMIRMAAYLPVGMMTQLVRLYRLGPERWQFKMALAIASRWSALLLEPLAYLRVFKMSCQGRVGKMMQLVPVFFRIATSRYIKQYSGAAMTLTEKIVRDNISHVSEGPDNVSGDSS